MVKQILSYLPQLQAFSDECRQLGRSYALNIATRTLREELDQLLRIFYHNARELSPLVQEPGQLVNHWARGDIDNESFPSCLESVANAFEMLCERLHEFQEYTVRDCCRSVCYLLITARQEESVNIKTLMGSFAKDLRVSEALRAKSKTQISHVFSLPNSIVLRA